MRRSRCRREIRQAELRHRALRGAGHEPEEQAQRVPVGEEGVSACASAACEVVAAEEFDEPTPRPDESGVA
jgi:hypothetical protein